MKKRIKGRKAEELDSYTLRLFSYPVKYSGATAKMLIGPSFRQVVLELTFVDEHCEGIITKSVISSKLDISAESSCSESGDSVERRRVWVIVEWCCVLQVGWQGSSGISAVDVFRPQDSLCKDMGASSTCDDLEFELVSCSSSLLEGEEEYAMPRLLSGIRVWCIWFGDGSANMMTWGAFVWGQRAVVLFLLSCRVAEGLFICRIDCDQPYMCDSMQCTCTKRFVSVLRRVPVHC